MYLLTFLGIGSRNKDGELTGFYHRAKYKWQNSKPIETCWIAEACIEFFQIDKAFVVATEKSLEATWPNFQNAISLKCTVEPIRIGEGKSENELWEMFDAIVKPIPENCELVIDITHGFRSQPLIAMAIAIYLREVKHVAIAHVIYGAFEAKDEDSGITPVFSLDTFIDLIDWTFAIQSFVQTGGSKLLNAILQNTQKSAYTDQMRSKNSGNGLPRKLISVADSIDRVSRALHLLRPAETGKEVKNVLKILRDSRHDVESFAKPFAPLIDKIRDELEPLNYDINDFDVQSILKSQLSMIEWFLQKKKYMHAISLAREWGINYFAVLRGMNPARAYHRKLAEKWMNSLIYSDKQSDLDGLIQFEFIELFKRIQNFRNEIDHANDEQPASKLASNISKACIDLIEFGKRLQSKKVF